MSVKNNEVYVSNFHADFDACEFRSVIGVEGWGGVYHDFDAGVGARVGGDYT
jgi:hypothetical protein